MSVKFIEGTRYMAISDFAMSMDMDELVWSAEQERQDMLLTKKAVKECKTKKNSRWKPYEIESLMTYYQYGVCAVQFYGGVLKSNRSIHAKAKRLGLKGCGRGGKCVRPTMVNQFELELIRRLPPHEAAEKVPHLTRKRLHNARIALKNNGYKLLWNRRVLTGEEISILYKYYPKGGRNECIRRGLNRDKIHAAEAYAQAALGLRVSAEGVGKWKPRELEILKKHYPVGGYTACLQAGLRRSVRSIMQQALRHGIRGISKGGRKPWKHERKAEG